MLRFQEANQKLTTLEGIHKDLNTKLKKKLRDQELSGGELTKLHQKFNA